MDLEQELVEVEHKQYTVSDHKIIADESYYHKDAEYRRALALESIKLKAENPKSTIKQIEDQAFVNTYVEHLAYVRAKAERSKWTQKAQDLQVIVGALQSRVKLKAALTQNIGGC